jgi:Ala-tRNA(Pro) deacylase
MPQKMKGKEEIIAELRRLGIAFERFDHERVYTIDASKKLPDWREDTSCKTLFLREKERYFLLMLPGEKRFSAKALRASGFRHVTFAEPEKLSEMLGIYPGSVSALSLINDTEGRVELFADSELLGRELIDCHPADNACTLRMKTKDLLERFVPATGHAYTPIVIERPAPQP